MATPKKKISRGRRDRRRYSSAWAVESQTPAKCPYTGELVRKHRVSMAYVLQGLQKSDAKPTSQKNS